MEEESKHETAVITPELIEKSKQERLKNEESKKQALTDDSDEEEREDFSEDAFAQLPTSRDSEGLSETFEPTQIPKLPEPRPSDKNIFGVEDSGMTFDKTANFGGAFS